MDESAAGLFVSGGSMANLAALAAARSAKIPADLKRALLYASEESHHSIVKAAPLLGIGGENVRQVAVDSRLKCPWMILRRKSRAIVRLAILPFRIVANAVCPHCRIHPRA